MRIRFFIAPSLPKDHVGRLMAESLAATYADDNGVQIVCSSRSSLSDGHPESTPHIIHVFGSWDNAAANFLFKARRRGIPCVYSPVGGLISWNQNQESLQRRLSFYSRQRRMISQAETVVTFSQIERRSVEKMNKKSNIETLTNPIITNTVTLSTLSGQMLNIYQKAQKSFDEKIRQRINLKINAWKESDGIHMTLFQLYYIRHQLHQGAIPHDSIADLCQTMMTTDYNEDEMNDILQQLKMDKWMSRLEQILSETDGLTEGFMPSPPLNDGTTKKIKKFIES